MDGRMDRIRRSLVSEAGTKCLTEWAACQGRDTIHSELGVGQALDTGRWGEARVGGRCRRVRGEGRDGDLQGRGTQSLKREVDRGSYPGGHPTISRDP